MKDNFRELRNREFIVFAPEHYNTLGLIRSLGEEGFYPIYIAIKSRYKISSYSKYIKVRYDVDSIEEGYKILSQFANPFNKPFLYTIDDKTQAFLDTHYNELVNSFIFFNSGSANKTVYYMNKKNILDIAEECGLPVLKTYLINKDKNDIPKDLEYPIITKSRSPVEGGWKSDVHICNNESELLEVLGDIKSDQVLIQKYIDKANECCLDGYSVNKGNDLFLALESYYNYNLPGYYSPYMTTKTFDEILVPTSCLENLIKSIGFEGIMSIEFIIDKDGNFYFSEVNFRHSTWMYIATKNKMNLPVYWALSMLKDENVCPRHIIKNNYTAMVEPVDFQKRVIEKRATIFKWFHDLLHTNCKFYWNWRDLKPSFHMVFNNKVFR